MIPVKITRPVYIRKGPGPSHNKLGVAQPSGKTILMDGVVEGEVHKGINKHYHITNDKGEKQYYWSGRVEEQAYNYNQLIQNIPNEWRKTNGEGVTVAILDTGCYAHPFLEDALVLQYDVFNKNSTVADDNDKFSHGTFVAGIIAARNNTSIKGVSPKVKLIIIKVADNGSNVNEDNVYDGLNWLLTKSTLTPDIVNISLDVTVSKNGQKFKDAFKALSDKKVTILAAAQNNAGLLESLNYPAKEDHVIAVGALCAQSTVITNGDSDKINTKVKYLIPDIIYRSLKSLQSDTTTNKGCSFSTALVSGILSLALADARAQNINMSLTDFMNQSIQQFNANLFTNELNIYKL